MIRVIGLMLALGLVFTALEMLGAWVLLRSFH